MKQIWIPVLLPPLPLSPLLSLFSLIMIEDHKDLCVDSCRIEKHNQSQNHISQDSNNTQTHVYLQYIQHHHRSLYVCFITLRSGGLRP